MNYNNTYWNQEWVYTKIREYFGLKELVRQPVIDFFVDRYGKKRGIDMCWSLFDFRLFSNLLFMRINLDRTFTANDYEWGGRFDERGYRDNMCDIMQSKHSLYLTPHLGDAVDFVVKEMNSEDVRMWAKDNENRFPYHARFEHKHNGKPISWVHLDCRYQPTNPKVYLFDI